MIYTLKQPNWNDVDIETAKGNGVDIETTKLKWCIESILLEWSRYWNNQIEITKLKCVDNKTTKFNWIRKECWILWQLPHTITIDFHINDCLYFRYSSTQYSWLEMKGVSYNVNQ